MQGGQTLKQSSDQRGKKSLGYRQNTRKDTKSCVQVSTLSLGPNLGIKISLPLRVSYLQNVQKWNPGSHSNLLPSHNLRYTEKESGKRGLTQHKSYLMGFQNGVKLIIPPGYLSVQVWIHFHLLMRNLSCRPSGMLLRNLLF